LERGSDLHGGEHDRHQSSTPRPRGALASVTAPGGRRLAPGRARRARPKRSPRRQPHGSVRVHAGSRRRRFSLKVLDNHGAGPTSDVIDLSVRGSEP
jgi:hypothetical protein